MAAAIYNFLLLLFVYRNVAGVNLEFYPKYHFAPPKGWMNDPNGFCYFRDNYHLFYQYDPSSSLGPGTPHWGHAISEDLVNWKHEPIALFPDKSYDSNGVFSGSAIVENDAMYLFYTGNVNHPDETPDHEQHQALAWSTDGINFTKYENNPIIQGSDRQPNFRDPKVWKHRDTYYMVLGNSFDNDTLGRALLYASKDMKNWEEVSILDQSYGSLGYMWECPDFFELDGLFVLLFSPQGIKRQDIHFNNLYQTGYIIGNFDYETKEFTPLTEFRELDSGHDFYATQTIEDKDGNRVMIAWFDMWEQYYPERRDGFTGCMTLPRILKLDRYLRLTQNPVEQINQAVGRKLHSGLTNRDTLIELQNNTAKIEVRSASVSDLHILIDTTGQFSLTIKYNHANGLVTLDRGGDDGKRSARWRPNTFKLRMTIYIDRSTVEVILGYGEATFSSRIFPDGSLRMRLEESYDAYVAVYSMDQTVPTPEEN